MAHHVTGNFEVRGDIKDVSREGVPDAVEAFLLVLSNVSTLKALKSLPCYLVGFVPVVPCAKGFLRILK